MKNPIQPLALDKHGTLRFKPNKIVEHLLELTRSNGLCDMNTIATLGFSKDDRQQFAQLIGYSLGGYGELQSYVDDVAYNTAEAMYEKKLPETEAQFIAMQATIVDLTEKLQAILGICEDGLEGS